MPEQPNEALRKALNDMEAMRKRSVALSRFLLFTSIAFMFPTYAIFLFKGNVALGMPFALCTLWAAIFGSAISLGGVSNANTQRILKAIETLSRGERKTD